MFAFVRIENNTGNILNSAFFEGKRTSFEENFKPFLIYGYDQELEKDIDITETDDFSLIELSHEELEQLLQNGRIEKLDAEELRKQIKVFKTETGHEIVLRETVGTIDEYGNII